MLKLLLRRLALFALLPLWTAHAQIVPAIPQQSESRIYGDPNDVRFGGEMELGNIRTLTNFMRFLKIQVPAPLMNDVLSKIPLTTLDDYLDNPDNFEHLNPEMRMQLSEGVEAPGSSIESAKKIPEREMTLEYKAFNPAAPGSRIEAPETLSGQRRAEQGLILPDSSPTRSNGALYLPDGTPAQSGDELIRVDNTQINNEDRMIADSANASTKVGTENRKYWENISKNWKKLPVEAKKAAVDLNRIPNKVKALLFIEQIIGVDNLSFDPKNPLPAKDKELLQDILITRDPGGTIEVKYRTDSHIHGVDEHLKRMELLTRMAGVDRVFQDPLSEMSTVLKNENNRHENMKGLTYHFHTSKEGATEFSADNKEQVDMLAVLKALKMKNYQRVAAAKYPEKGINKYGSSYEWRNHFLSPREEAKMIREVLLRNEPERTEYLNEQIKDIFADPLVRQRFSELTNSSTKFQRDTFLNYLKSENFRRAVGDDQATRAVHDSISHIIQIEPFDKQIGSVLTLDQGYVPWMRERILSHPEFMKKFRAHLRLGKKEWSDADKRRASEIMSSLPYWFFQSQIDDVNARMTPNLMKDFMSSPLATMQALKSRGPSHDKWIPWEKLLETLKNSQDPKFREGAGAALALHAWTHEPSPQETARGSLKQLLKSTLSQEEHRATLKKVSPLLPVKSLLDSALAIELTYPIAPILSVEEYVGHLSNSMKREFDSNPQKVIPFIHPKMILEYILFLDEKSPQRDELLKHTAVLSQKLANQLFERGIVHAIKVLDTLPTTTMTEGLYDRVLTEAQNRETPHQRRKLLEFYLRRKEAHNPGAFTTYFSQVPGPEFFKFLDGVKMDVALLDQLQRLPGAATKEFTPKTMESIRKLIHEGHLPENSPAVEILTDRLLYGNPSNDEKPRLLETYFKYRADKPFSLNRQLEGMVIDAAHMPHVKNFLEHSPVGFAKAYRSGLLSNPTPILQDIIRPHSMTELSQQAAKMNSVLDKIAELSSKNQANILGQLAKLDTTPDKSRFHELINVSKLDLISSTHLFFLDAELFKTYLSHLKKYPSISQSNFSIIVERMNNQLVNDRNGSIPEDVRLLMLQAAPHLRYHDWSQDTQLSEMHRDPRVLQAMGEALKNSDTEERALKFLYSHSAKIGADPELKKAHIALYDIAKTHIGLTDSKGATDFRFVGTLYNWAARLETPHGLPQPLVHEYNRQMMEWAEDRRWGGGYSCKTLFEL